ncbi:uncharacterized protein LTR77_009961 [Saxophila tyrrhenica]|uniref:BZIP domain-containing protein n=1 Tax=Saxophila tyrrhenica TaxID=1690608 RepID=A0AAV9NZB8_9PEZI|nr:hypothetical protein LTR77_009961 [Saxophila tyrrhenica]
MSQIVASPVQMADDCSGDICHLPSSTAGTCFQSTLPSHSCSSQPMPSFASSPWEMTPQLSEVPSLMSHSNGSSPSNSSSGHEGFIGVAQEQHNKRRAQNRAAQRAYRDRKMRHMADLEIGIRDVEEKIRRLQSENTELIRELCEIRAENREWKQCQTQANTSVRTPHHRQNRPVRASEASRRPRDLDNTTDGVEDAGTDDVFDAVWNLIELDPSVVKGNVKAEAFLQRLRGLVDSGAQQASQLGSTLDDGLDNPHSGGRRR